jgi:DNA invertase Pin-like site-specific DNA recombinase
VALDAKIKSRRSNSGVKDICRAGMRRAKLEGRRIGRAPLNINRVAVVADRRSGMSLTAVAKKYRISRATVCRLVNESNGPKKAIVPQLGNEQRAVPQTESSDLATAA